MDTPSLVEVRTGGGIKAELREITYDIADEFGLRGVADPRPVPHIPLLGRYGTDRGSSVKQSLVRVLSEFDVVPYRVSGFDAFEDRNLVYANVQPSPELCLLRHRISDELQPLTDIDQQRSERDPFEFHIPIAHDDGADFDTDPVLSFLETHQDVEFDEYATRITNLDERRMLWEYDLLADSVLQPDEATSRESWQRTESLLEERRTDTDHELLVAEPCGSVIAIARRRGWEFFSDPVEHVTERARGDGLHRADGGMCQRELYFGDTYAYLVFAAGHHTADITVLSQTKSDLRATTIEAECPVCHATVHQHDERPVLPCHRCGFQHDREDVVSGRETPTSSDISEMCVRCNRPIRSGGIAFGERVYCDDCVSKFESVAERGVVVQSRHGEPDYEDRPYVVHWNGASYEADDQYAALARGKELADTNDVPGLFIYERRGSHWLLDTYLDTHPDIESKVEGKRRRIRGEDRVQIDTGTGETESETAGHSIRAEGDVFIADTAVKDAVVNRSDIGDGDQTDQQ